MSDLLAVGRPVNDGCLAFMDEAGACLGFIQLLPNGDRGVIIHRLWTLQSGNGNGSKMLGMLCAIADRHGAEITLKVTPFGRKPYPMTREQLAAWYARYGFVGNLRKMIRKPVVTSSQTSP